MKKGKSLKELAAWTQDLIPRICHNFTVDDLGHLYRGGRVSKTTAVLGTFAGIKPILHVDEQGHLIPINKVREIKNFMIHPVGPVIGTHSGPGTIALFFVGSPR